MNPKFVDKDPKVKSNHWTIVFYPDSVPTGWGEYLDSLGVTYFWSLHNKYTNGEKDHYHLGLLYPGNTTRNNVAKIAKMLGSNLPPQVMASEVGIMRYMIHADNPEKPQYPKGQIFCHGQEALDLLDLAFDPTQTRLGKKKATKDSFFEMADVIFGNGYYQWPQLINYIKERQPDSDNLMFFAMNNAFMVDKWLTAQYHILTRPVDDVAKLEPVNVVQDYEENKDKLKDDEN